MTNVIHCSTINIRGVDIYDYFSKTKRKRYRINKSLCKINNISLSDLIRNAVLEKIEDEYDLECYNKAIEEYRKNPKTYTMEEVKKELGL